MTAATSEGEHRTAPVVLHASCVAVEGRAVVDFIDNGAGIPENRQSMIFEKFARADDHRAAGGAGLGLAICREVMRRLGGQIDYLPDQDGTGFRVTLPENVEIERVAETES